ncbi:MAG TPA: hypothetical protein VIU11_14415 [Nakamurella sp.]
MSGPFDFYRSTAEVDAFECSAPVGPWTDDELRADIHPGDPGQLKKYWLSGKGLAKWATKPHPWTALYHHILKHVGNPEKAKRIASQWYHDHFGHWPGERKGKNPIGKG